jgi:hypothetical protein
MQRFITLDNFRFLLASDLCLGVDRSLLLKLMNSKGTTCTYRLKSANFYPHGPIVLHVQHLEDCPECEGRKV